MAITQQELGTRIRAAREASRMTQHQVAKHLGVSRPTVVQIEAGNRSVSSLDLDKVAYLFGRDLREFVAESFQAEDTLAALFRAQPDVVEQPAAMEKMREKLRECQSRFMAITVQVRCLTGPLAGYIKTI